MSAADGDGPAFPMSYDRSSDHADHPGMSLRDYFAAKAMQGIVSGNVTWRDLDYIPKNGLSIIRNDARMAYQIADAMIVERDA